MIDYEKELNTQQREAVFHESGPALVIAGAGSGKTRTLVYRVARLVEQGIEPQKIVLLTFTRRAAREMLVRASRLLADGKTEGVEGGTFHSFANTILHRYGSGLAVPRDFSILDRADNDDLIQHLRVDLGFAKKGRRFPQKSTIGELFSKESNTRTPLSELLEAEYPQFLQDFDDLTRLQTAWRTYKQDHHLLDYDDLLLALGSLLAEHPHVRLRAQELFRHVLVDEYQDTNILQADILRNLVKPGGNIMAVGDDAQSIYSFRGAHFRNIMDFPQQFPGAKIFKIEQNYRSTQEILDAANEVIRRSAEGYTKVLFTEKRGRVKPQLVVCPDDHAQSVFVAGRIVELREAGVPLERIAVLFRSSFHSFDLEAELAHRNIPFVKYGGFKLMETAHIKDLLAHMKLLLNPRDIVAAQRMFRLLEGIGPVAAHALGQAVAAAGNVVAALNDGALPEQYAAKTKALASVFRELKNTGAPHEQVSLLCNYLEPVVARVYRDDYRKRFRDLAHLAHIARRFRSAERFVQDMALSSPDDSIARAEGVENEEEPLVLSTVHSAKGLEWHAVFILSALDGFFPADYSFKAKEEVEEERRLLYVAMTRAKEELYVSYPEEIAFASRGMPVISAPSRFLEGIAEDILEPVIFTPS